MKKSVHEKNDVEMKNKIAEDGRKFYEYLVRKQQESLIETPKDFGRELKKRIEQEATIRHLADFASNVKMNIAVVEPGFDDVLSALNAMSFGPEFELSNERLVEIANDLIAEKKNINLNY